MPYNPKSERVLEPRSRSTMQNHKLHGGGGGSAPRTTSRIAALGDAETPNRRRVFDPRAPGLVACYSRGSGMLGREGTGPPITSARHGGVPIKANFVVDGAASKKDPNETPRDPGYFRLPPSLVSCLPRLVLAHHHCCCCCPFSAFYHHHQQQQQPPWSATKSATRSAKDPLGTSTLPSRKRRAKRYVLACDGDADAAPMRSAVAAAMLCAAAVAVTATCEMLHPAELLLSLRTNAVH